MQGFHIGIGGSYNCYMTLGGNNEFILKYWSEWFSGAGEEAAGVLQNPGEVPPTAFASEMEADLKST